MQDIQKNMNTSSQLKNLFLRQSYLDSWDDYDRSIRKSSFIKWDYIILTASNEAQAETYRNQINARLAEHLLPESVHYAVLPDPDGKRVGSGGATLNAMRYVKEHEKSLGREGGFRDKRILVIHSGGDSKRVPQYSACGKLFSPVPRQLPDGRGSTLFDEFIIGMSGVPSRFKEGMLVLSGDVLLLFNPLQIDAMFNGAAAISIKEPVSTGKNHGVFLNNGKDVVKRFLHKQSEEHLREVGAVNENDCVDLDTGAVLFDCRLMDALYELVCTDGELDNEKFDFFVNETSRISFYGDILYPLAEESTLEDYYKEAAEGTINPMLLECRRRIWEKTRGFSMKLICLSPAEFIHFGTTRELKRLLTEDISDYSYLNWSRHISSTVNTGDYASHTAYIADTAVIGKGAYIENSAVINSTVGEGSIVSGIRLEDAEVPGGQVWHGLFLSDDSFCIRVYGVNDNPKGRREASFLNTTLEGFMQMNKLAPEELWDDVSEDYLWFARLYPVCTSMSEACAFAGLIGKMASGTADVAELEAYKKAKRVSLYESFNMADLLNTCRYENHLESCVLAYRFNESLMRGESYEAALKVFGRRGITEEIYTELMKVAEKSDFSLRIRIYYAVSRFLKDNELALAGVSYDVVEAKCFDYIQKVIYDDAVRHLPLDDELRICRDEVTVKLPVRVNWGGGWTDTPPQCIEKGGCVLNCAMKLRGIYPVQVTVRRLDRAVVSFASDDIGVEGTVTSIDDIRNCHNPYDSFALHKAALIACGVIPLSGADSLEDVLERLGGGIFLSTQVYGVPKGSGLGTSSILSAACVKAIYEFLGKELSNDSISDIVLCMEQIMSTGGGWQDQVGGLTTGIKFIRSEPGIHQKLSIEYVKLKDKTKKELNERFALIYTGQRRLARNLLRDVIGGYIGQRPETIESLSEMSRVAALMRFELERGDIDAFAQLLDRHWELSKLLDSGSTNTCIDQMFLACEDLICGRFIAGAGGGGFLQVILKKGVTKRQLRDRLRSVFQDSGVDVWDCELLFD